MRALILACAVPVGLALAAPTLAAPAWAAGQSAPMQFGTNRPAPGVWTLIPPYPDTASSPVAAAMPADPDYHGRPYVGALTAPPLTAIDKDYPVCTATLRDGCINPAQIVPPRRHRQRAAQPD
ncbi:hypothetical protein [Novosphingobium sp.]|uniref:hypothetical protein n=1 Tax=Novosphingobium sp. TaxID=1874826 RepID=UPI0033402877